MASELDLVTTRLIKAPRDRVWRAWADPRRLEQWWIPRPMVCRVVELDLKPGGAFTTQMSDGAGKPFVPHLAACFLDVVPEQTIVFSDVLLGGWRPSTKGFVTAVISFEEHPEGTLYMATAMHKDQATRDRHEELGFYEGWTTVANQLAALVEGEAD